MYSSVNFRTHMKSLNIATITDNTINNRLSAVYNIMGMWLLASVVLAAQFGTLWKMSGLDVPTELALVPSPPLCCCLRPSCSSYTATIYTSYTSASDLATQDVHGGTCPPHLPPPANSIPPGHGNYTDRSERKEDFHKFYIFFKFKSRFLIVNLHYYK